MYGFSGDAQYSSSAVSFAVTMEEDGASLYCQFEGKVSRIDDQVVIDGTLDCSLAGIIVATYAWTAQK